MVVWPSEKVTGQSWLEAGDDAVVFQLAACGKWGGRQKRADGLSALSGVSSSVECGEKRK